MRNEPPSASKQLNVVRSGPCKKGIRYPTPAGPCLVAVLSQSSYIAQGTYHHCGSFILIHILYLVGVLLMTFDLQTCGHSQANGFPPVYISKVLFATISEQIMYQQPFYMCNPH